MRDRAEMVVQGFILDFYSVVKHLPNNGRVFFNCQPIQPIKLFQPIRPQARFFNAKQASQSSEFSQNVSLMEASLICHVTPCFDFCHVTQWFDFCHVTQCFDFFGLNVMF